jgi:hypothetical protein
MILVIKDYRYVYKPAQQKFYLENGLIPVFIGMHKKTKKTFFKFEDNEKLQNVFDRWMKRKYKSQ